jgi:hypothetical protein
MKANTLELFTEAQYSFYDIFLIFCKVIKFDIEDNKFNLE